jgi:hypothetical protein
MTPRVRIWIESVLAVLIGGLGILTIFWSDWIEGILGWDPDHGNGSVERYIVIGLIVIGVAFFSISRIEVRRLAAAHANT